MKLTKVACLIQDVVSPYCGDKGMARRCTRRSLPNYFDMTSYHWNVRLIGSYIRSLERPGDLPRVIEILCLFASTAKKICAHLTKGWAFIFDYFFPSSVDEKKIYSVCTT
jgi:SAM-dependent MidA family methyltransferase